eukprot:2192344-Amphidinium_carterae.1
MLLGSIEYDVLQCTWLETNCLHARTIMHHGSRPELLQRTYVCLWLAATSCAAVGRPPALLLPCERFLESEKDAH